MTSVPSQMNSLDQRLLSAPRRRGAWLQRALFAALAVVFIVIAFFFITVAVIAGAFLALAVGVRWWWIMRRVRAASKASEALEGEYTVVVPTRNETRRSEL